MKSKTCERVALTASTKRRLWAESGGFCQNPMCANELFPDDDLDADFAEMAHIIPASTGGPRDVSPSVASSTDRAHHSNIAVLCANCHTIVDKDSLNFPTELILHWKREHRSKLLRVLATPTYTTRAEARTHVSRLLTENRLIFNRYGPVRGNFSESRASQWTRHLRDKIIPNNRELIRVIDANSAFLLEDEVDTLSRFRLHADELESRHLLQDWSAGSSQFPTSMDDILAES